MLNGKSLLDHNMLFSSSKYGSLDFRFSKIDELRNYYLEEIKQGNLNSNIKFCIILTYIEQLHILVSALTGCFSIFVFASLTGIRIGITSSEVGLETHAITAGIIKNNLVIQKIRKNA